MTEGIFARSILSSVCPETGVRADTVHIRQPRMIHAEFMTHREFSRNGRSSRAVPVTRLLAEAEDPYVPGFMANGRGMVATEPLDPAALIEAERIWRNLAAYTLDCVKQLQVLNVHKQWANRPLEWFGYIDVLVTSTSWANWEALRDDDAAQPEVQLVAQCVLDAVDSAVPQHLHLTRPGEQRNWHLPFFQESDWSAVQSYIRSSGSDLPEVEIFKRISAARCARITFEAFDGKADIASELARFDRLVTEHQLTPDRLMVEPARWALPHLHGNTPGWIQHRKMIAGEVVRERRPTRRPRISYRPISGGPEGW